MSGQAVVTAGRVGSRVSWRAAMGYALYALLAFAVFLVWFFPVEGLQTKLLAEVERRVQATVTVQNRDWLFPLGVAWQGVRIVPVGHPDRAVVLDAIRVDLAVLPLLRRRIEADLTWEAYGGKARGSWSLRREGDDTRLSLDQFGQGFEVGQLPGLPEGSWQGVLQVDLNGRWLNEAWWLGEGTGSVEVSRLKVDGLTVGGFPVNGIEFDSVTGHVSLNGGTITLQRLAAHGPLGKVSGDGTVLVRAPWTESVINLTLRLEPTADAKARVPMLALSGGGAVTVRVSGRLARPGVSVNGAPVV
ncbi:MAG: type II secretion system protein GspN [Nitrospirota bacterium]